VKLVLVIGLTAFSYSQKRPSGARTIKELCLTKSCAKLGHVSLDRQNALPSNSLKDLGNATLGVFVSDTTN